jgi:RNA 3'-terminal phosphate cyclase (ATP)
MLPRPVVAAANNKYRKREMGTAAASPEKMSCGADGTATASNTAIINSNDDDVMIEIDGSYGEGGGQMIRNACAFAAILKKNIHLIKIRENRKPKSGLQRQHLVGMQMLQEASSTNVANNGFHVAELLGSNECYFMGANNYQMMQQQQHATPTRKRQCTTEITGDTQTAGSICLLLQAALPYGLFSGIHDEIKFVLKGGTNATMAPQYDYFQHVFLPMLQRCGNIPRECIHSHVISRGFFPRGGGHVQVTVWSPTIHDPHWKLSPIRLKERGDIVHISVRAFTAGNCHKSMSKKLAAVAKTHVVEHLDPSSSQNVNTHVDHHASCFGSGCGILLVATTSTGCILGGSAIGSPKTPLEDTAKHAAAELVDAIQGGGCVDDYLQDQLILYMALAEGVSEIKTNGVTMHTRTAIWLAEQLCDGVKFEVISLSRPQQQEETKVVTPAELTSTKISGCNHHEGKIPGLHLIRCRGLGYSAALSNLS